MQVLLAIFALATAEPAPQAASQEPAAQPAAATKAKSDKSEQVCVTRAEVGSRFKQKTCHDKVEYERRQLEERKALERIQRGPLTGN